MQTIKIGNRAVGEEYPCFIIAEAGSNHNGSLESALRLIDIAADAGADAVKFQLFRAASLYPKSAGQSDYLKFSRGIYDIIKEMEMPEAWLHSLVSRSREKGVFFSVSVFDESLADLAESYVDFFKIASYELTHLPLIRQVAKKNKPTVMSTGTANLHEVEEAVKTFYDAGNDQLCLMQCTASYPAPFDSLNLRAIVTMRQAFGIPVGLSDHSRDPFVGPMAAVALGANLLEKHYTFSNELPGPDHRFALEASELRTMVRRLREVEACLGTGVKAPLSAEEELRAFARRTIFVTRDVRPGEVLTRENTAVLRAGKYPLKLPPVAWDKVLGRRVKHGIPAETPLDWEDIQ